MAFPYLYKCAPYTAYTQFACRRFYSYRMVENAAKKTETDRAHTFVRQRAPNERNSSQASFNVDTRWYCGAPHTEAQRADLGGMSRRYETTKRLTTDTIANGGVCSLFKPVRPFRISSEKDTI